MPISTGLTGPIIIDPNLNNGTTAIGPNGPMGGFINSPQDVAAGVAVPSPGLTYSTPQGPLTMAQPAPLTQPTAATPASPGALTPAQNDALARLSLVLAQYGLSSLEAWLKEKLIQGASDSQILLELYQQPAFQQRFPAIEARRQAGLNPLSPAEILGYETQVSQLIHMAGLPASFASSSYAQSMLSRDVSIAELSARIEQGFLKVQEAPQAVRDAFGQYFGANSDSAIAALFLDPDKALPELEKMAMTAYVGGIGNIFAVNLGAAKAREIADTGLSQAAIWQGYRQLDTLSPLFEETLGERTDLTKEGVGVDAVFGTAPGAENTLERRRQTRVASFSGGTGGGVLSTQQGAVGAGVADH